jgi:hypothetical protein
MTDTVESAHETVSEKIDSIGAMLDIIETVKAKKLADPETVSEVKDEYTTISECYNMGVTSILAKYYNPNANRATRDEISGEYYDFIACDDYVGQLDALVVKIKLMIRTEGLIDYVPINRLLMQYSRQTLEVSVKQINFTLCPNCNTEMAIHAWSSGLKCRSCGIDQELKGTVFDDSQFYHQEGNKTKHGEYNPARHFKQWMDYIQGRDAGDIPQAVIDRLEDLMDKNRVMNKSHVTYEQFRKYLKTIKKTTYNKNIPRIKRMITGVCPPQINVDDEYDLSISFDKVIEIWEHVKISEKENSVPYYPYIIYKLIDLKYPPTHIYRGLLECIHMQGRNTVIKNDKRWKRICEYSQKHSKRIFEYRPTPV